MRLLNTRLSLICAAAMLYALAPDASLAGCGGSSSADPLEDDFHRELGLDSTTSESDEVEILPGG